MRIALVVVLAVAAVVVLGGFSRGSVRLADTGRDAGSALKDASSAAARGLAERVDGATNQVDETASRKASEVADAAKTGTARVTEDVRARVAETVADKTDDLAEAVRAAAASALRWASDRVRELASRVEP